jgi:hypothetical protein
LNWLKSAGCPSSSRGRVPQSRSADRKPLVWSSECPAVTTTEGNIIEPVAASEDADDGRTGAGSTFSPR